MELKNTMFLVCVSYGEWDDSNKKPIGVTSSYDEATLLVQELKDTVSDMYKELCVDMGWDIGYVNFDATIMELPYYSL